MEKIEEKQNRNQEEILIIDRGQQEKNKANGDNKLKQQEKRKGTAGRNSKDKQKGIEKNGMNRMNRRKERE